jgi:hypothetical protein
MICLAVRKEKDTKSLLSKERNVLERTGIRRSKLPYYLELRTPG